MPTFREWLEIMRDAIACAVFTLTICAVAFVVIGLRG